MKLPLLPCRPVGYVVFVDERFAGMAQSAYHLWQGFGNGGLMVDMLVEHRPDGGGPPQDSQYRGGGGPLKRPPVDALGAPPPPSNDCLHGVCRHIEGTIWLSNNM